MKIQEQNTAKMVADAYNACFKEPRKIGKHPIYSDSKTIGELHVFDDGKTLKYKAMYYGFPDTSYGFPNKAEDSIQDFGTFDTFEEAYYYVLGMHLENWAKQSRRVVEIAGQMPPMTQSERLDTLFDEAVKRIKYPAGTKVEEDVYLREPDWGIEGAEILVLDAIKDGVTFNDISDEKTYERLHAAVFFCNDTLVKVLLDMGTDPNATFEGRESQIGALCRCVGGNERSEPASLRIATYLINAGAVVNIDPELFLERNTPLRQLLIKHRKAQLASKG